MKTFSKLLLIGSCTLTLLLPPVHADWNVTRDKAQDQADLTATAFNFVKDESTFQEYFEKLFRKLETQEPIFPKKDRKLEKYFSSEEQITAAAQWFLALARTKKWSIDLNKKNENGNTYVHRAAGFKKGAMIGMLLKERKRGTKIDLNEPNTLGNTPLMSSIIAGSPAAFSKLMKEKDVDITRANDKGETPFLAGFKACKNDYLEPLIKRQGPPSADLMIDGSKASDWVISKDCVQGFNAIYPELDSRTNSLKLPADSEGMPVLHKAAVFGALGIIRNLEGRGVDIFQKDGSPVSTCNANPPQKQKATSKTKQGPPCGFTAYQHALMNGQDEVYEYYLSKRPKIINEKDPNTGNTPLMTSIERQDTRMVSLLLRHKPDFGAINNQGKTAMTMLIAWRDALEKISESDPLYQKSRSELALIDGFLKKMPSKVKYEGRDKLMIAAIEKEDPESMKLLLQILPADQIASLEYLLIEQSKLSAFKTLMSLDLGKDKNQAKAAIFSSNTLYLPANRAYFDVAISKAPDQFRFAAENGYTSIYILNNTDASTLEKVLSLKPPLKFMAYGEAIADQLKRTKDEWARWSSNSSNNTIDKYKRDAFLRDFDKKMALLEKHGYYTKEKSEAFLKDAKKEIKAGKPLTLLKNMPLSSAIQLSYVPVPANGYGGAPAGSGALGYGMYGLGMYGFTKVDLLQLAVFYNDKKLAAEILAELKKEKITQNSTYFNTITTFATDEMRGIFKKAGFALPTQATCSTEVQTMAWVDYDAVLKWMQSPLFNNCNQTSKTYLITLAIQQVSLNQDYAFLDALLAHEKNKGGIGSSSHSYLWALQSLCNKKIYEKLIDAGFDLSVSDNSGYYNSGNTYMNYEISPLGSCVHNKEAFDFLLSKGADINKHNLLINCMPPMYIGYFNGSSSPAPMGESFEDCSKRLIDNGFNVFTPNTLYLYSEDTTYLEILNKYSPDYAEKVLKMAIEKGQEPYPAIECKADTKLGKVNNELLQQYNREKNNLRLSESCDSVMSRVEFEYTSDLTNAGLWLKRLKTVAMEYWLSEVNAASGKAKEKEEKDLFKKGQMSPYVLWQVDNNSPQQRMVPLCCGADSHYAQSCLPALRCKDQIENRSPENTICERFNDMPESETLSVALHKKKNEELKVSLELNRAGHTSFEGAMAQLPSWPFEYFSFTLPNREKAGITDYASVFKLKATDKTKITEKQVLEALSKDLDKQSEYFYTLMHLTSLRDFMGYKYPQCLNELKHDRTAAEEIQAKSVENNSTGKKLPRKNSGKDVR